MFLKKVVKFLSVAEDNLPPRPEPEARTAPVAAPAPAQVYTPVDEPAKAPDNIEKISCLYCGSHSATQYRNVADIVKCDSCGLIYLRTRPTKETMYQIYQVYANDTSHMRPPASVTEASTHGLRREWFVKEVIGHSRYKTGSWLDIGCGWGALLMRARECGFTPMGIEMTRINLDFANLQLRIPVSNSQFTDSSIPASSCEVISMVHVLEHIPNPKETLRRIYDTLVPGGLFCGIVPNIDSYCSEIQGEHWVWLDPTHHYVHYTPATLRHKLEEAGFIVESIYTAVGDGNDFFSDVLKAQHPGLDATALEAMREQLEKDGKGEEIRYYVRRPL